MHLATETMTVPGASSGATRRAVARTAKEGVASTTKPLWGTVSNSLVTFSSSGRGTPASRGFSRLSQRISASLGSKDHNVTSFPLSSSSRARAVPQPPLPSTVIFIA